MCLNEALLMSTHNVCFYGDLEKIIPQSYANTFLKNSELFFITVISP